MSERVVFHGRFITDGMWLMHLTWGALTLPTIGGGLWACWASTGQAPAAGALAFVGLLLVLTGLVMANVWKIATHAIVLKPDSLWCRPGFVKSVSVPYRDMTLLGTTSRGFGVVYRKERRGRQVESLLNFPPWALSNRPFREELLRRAPQIKVSDETAMRLCAFRSRTGALTILWVILLLPLLFIAIMWRPQGAPVSKEWLISVAVAWVVVLVALIAWQEIGQQRIRRDSHPS